MKCVHAKDEIFVFVHFFHFILYYSSCVMLVHFPVPTCHKGLADDVMITRWWYDFLDLADDVMITRWWYDFLSSILEHSCLREKIRPDQTVSLLCFK